MRPVSQHLRPESHPAPAASSVVEPEILFEEARQLQRRRRRNRAALILAAAAVSGAIAALLPSGGSRSQRLQRFGRSGPMVDLSAMRREGELAFISRNDLFLLDGSARSIHEIQILPGWTVTDPMFSPDGRWVAYETEYQSNRDPPPFAPRFWVARADGSDRRQITGVDAMFGWSPSRDLLAVSTDTTTRSPSGESGATPTRVDLVSPTGARSGLVTLSGPAAPNVAGGYQIWSAVWSPSGGALAVSLVSFTKGSIIRSYPVDGDKPTTWFSISVKAALPGVCQGCGEGGTIADLAGWWPKWGVGFWVYSSGAVRNLDGTPVELVRTPAASPRIIGWTLSDGETDAIAANSRGSLALVASTSNAGRDYGRGKEVKTCSLARETCAPIPDASVWSSATPLRCESPCLPTPKPGQPGSGVTLDPAWSPTTNLLAYVKSPVAYNAGNPPLAWYSAHELDVYDPATQESMRIADVQGVSVPTWSSNGKSLLYVAGDSLWLAPALGGKPVEVETPLFSPAQWLNPPIDNPIPFYGQVPWTAQFSWSSP